MFHWPEQPVGLAGTALNLPSGLHHLLSLIKKVYRSQLSLLLPVSVILSQVICRTCAIHVHFTALSEPHKGFPYAVRILYGWRTSDPFRNAGKGSGLSESSALGRISLILGSIGLCYVACIW